MPSARAGSATPWVYLKETMDRIMTEDWQTCVAGATYINFYTTVYNYIMSSHPDFGGSSRSLAADLASRDLYNKLANYFATHVEGLKEQSDSLQDEHLLRYYVGEWDRYTTGAYYIGRLFTYLNRHFVASVGGKGHEGVYPIHTLARVQWKSGLFLHLQGQHGKLASAILRQIERQRNDEAIDEGLVKKAVDSFVSLGLDKTNINAVSLDVYKEHLEIPYLEATEKYYRQGSEPLPPGSSVANYLKKVQGHLREEVNRVDRQLHTDTRGECIRKCTQVLILQPLTLTLEDFRNSLDFEKDEDLEQIYLLSQIPGEMEPVTDKFGEHVKKAGLTKVLKLFREGAEGSDEVNPKVYIDTLFEEHHKHSEMVTHSFKGEAGFVASLDRACGEFVNRNAATGMSTTKSPELLVKHADMLLRKNNKAGDEDLSGALNRVMILFKYIEDKDVFQTFYTMKLSKRLLHGVSASEEAEASMVAKLKEACGFEYTKKLQRMFTDMTLSKDLTDRFKGRMRRSRCNVDINFRVMVLSTGFWPLNAPNDGFIVPPEILPTYDRFSKFYQTLHSGRKLTWLWSYSENELRTNYLNRSYLLTVSSYQMAVLLQYNIHDTISLEELVTATEISKETLVQVLSLLVKANVLFNKRPNQYGLNLGFKPKKIRVNLNRPIKTEVKAESSQVLDTVEKDRKYMTQATIVRIMKARKKMTSRQLMGEVISQISHLFTPKVPDIKQAIEALLEKEYIERVDGRKDTFGYVA